MLMRRAVYCKKQKTLVSIKALNKKPSTWFRRLFVYKEVWHDIKN